MLIKIPPHQVSTMKLAVSAIVLMVVAGCLPPAENESSDVESTSPAIVENVVHDTSAVAEEIEKQTTIASWNGSNFDDDISIGASLSDDEVSVVVSGDFSSASSGGRTSGAIFRMNNTQEAAASGNTVTVTVTAKGGAYSVAYSTNEVGNSGWKTVEGTPEWSTYKFRYPVPGLVKGGGDFIGIIPNEAAIGVHVRRVSVLVD